MWKQKNYNVNHMLNYLEVNLNYFPINQTIMLEKNQPNLNQLFSKYSLFFLQKKILLQYDISIFYYKNKKQNLSRMHYVSKQFRF